MAPGATEDFSTWFKASRNSLQRGDMTALRLLVKSALDGRIAQHVGPLKTMMSRLDIVVLLEHVDGLLHDLRQRDVQSIVEWTVAHSQNLNAELELAQAGLLAVLLAAQHIRASLPAPIDSVQHTLHLGGKLSLSIIRQSMASLALRWLSRRLAS